MVVMLPWVLWVHSIPPCCNALVGRKHECLYCNVHEFNVWSLLPWSRELEQACHMSAGPGTVLPGARSHTNVTAGDGKTFWQKWA